jgi:hypothetical protein
LKGATSSAGKRELENTGFLPATSREKRRVPVIAGADHGGTMAADLVVRRLPSGLWDYGDGTFGWARIGGAL